MKKLGVKKIALWSGPRNISTALMYSFANRQDTKVIDEPLFGYFLKHTGVWRPSREEVLDSMDLNPSSVINNMIHPDVNQSVYFIKNMANHLLGLDWSFLANFHNIILTRHPKEMLLSYSQHMEKPTMLDTCYEIQHELLKYLALQNIPFIVVDSKQVLKNSERVLTKICEFSSISFSSNMLIWEKGPKIEDGIWAKYWYNNVHKSTSFGNYVSNDQKLPIHLIDIYEKCLIHYNQILKFQT
jgi:hypothetical protein